MIKNAMDTLPTTYQRVRLAAKWLLVILASYVVLRLTVAIAVPAYFLDSDWVMSIKLKCAQRPDLCVKVQANNAVVGNLWWGKGFYFTAHKGKAGELKAFVVMDMPESKQQRLLSPWNYVGAQFKEN